MFINKNNALNRDCSSFESKLLAGGKRSDNSVIKIEALDTSFFEDISISKQSTIRGGGRRPVRLFGAPYRIKAYF